MILNRYYRLSLTACWVFAALNCYGQIGNSSQRLIRKASEVFPRDHKQGILFAKQAALYAEAHSEFPGEIKAENILGEFFWEIGQPDSAAFYASNAIRKGQKTGIDSLAGDSWMILGMADHSKENFGKAAEEYQNALSAYQKRQKLQSVAIALRNLGICQKELGQYREAITNYFKAANMFASQGDHTDLAAAYNSIGLCLVSLKDFRQAVRYDLMALEIRGKLADSSSVAQSLNNTGFAYLLAKRPDSAIFYLSRCLKIRAHEKDSSLLILPLQNMGDAMADKGRIAEAQKYIRRSIAIAVSYNRNNDAAKGELDIAEIDLVEGQPQMALNNIVFAEKNAANTHSPEMLLKVYDLKYRAFLQMKNYRSALGELNKKNKVSDSLFTAVKNRTIQELSVKYQTAQRQRDLAALRAQNGLQHLLLTRQKSFIIALIAAGAFLLLLLAALYRNYWVKQAAAERIQLLLRDLHHRVKNNLQILSGIFSIQAEEVRDEKMRRAMMDNELRIVCMNMIHSELFLHEGNPRIQMKDYLERLLTYTQGVFLNEKVAVQSDISPMELDADKAIAIGLLVNELATNAFKYAGDKITFTARLQLDSAKDVLLELSDNGAGINVEAVGNENSFGLKLVRIITAQLGATLTITSDNGTDYRFVIPL